MCSFQDSKLTVWTFFLKTFRGSSQTPALDSPKAKKIPSEEINTVVYTSQSEESELIRGDDVGRVCYSLTPIHHTGCLHKPFQLHSAFLATYHTHLQTHSETEGLWTHPLHHWGPQRGTWQWTPSSPATAAETPVCLHKEVEIIIDCYFYWFKNVAWVANVAKSQTVKMRRRYMLCRNDCQYISLWFTSNLICFLQQTVWPS